MIGYRKMRKNLFIYVVIGFAVLWWWARYRRVVVYDFHIAVGQSLTLHAGSNNVELQLNSPNGSRRLRGTLGYGGVYISETMKPCSVSHSQYTGECVDVKIPLIGGDEPLLRLEVAGSNVTDCYMVNWRSLTTTKKISVMDCFDLSGALWFGGPQVLHQHWPINSQTSDLQPHLIGDYLSGKWRLNPAYGKYGSLAEPYWLSSAGVGIIVVDDCFTLSSSFNARGEGRLCLKGDRSPETDSSKVPTVLSYKICQRKDVASVHRTMSDLFVPRPQGYPDVRVIRQPIWSTWAQYKRNVNQWSVEEMADRILHYKFPHSQLEIDDRYSSTYGQFDFDVKKFPNASHMMRSLHDRGFRVTTWITPFSNVGSPATAEGAKKGVWITDAASLTSNPMPAYTKWWRGKGAVLDVTNQAAVDWFTGRLRQFSKEFGVDSFKFDAGELDYLPPRMRTMMPLHNLNRYTTLYVNMAATFGRMIEVRAGYRSQQLPIFVRMLDKESTWDHLNGLRSIIPTALVAGILGYPFVLPDMIGGNGYGDGIDGRHKPERELFIRWTELTAFLPAMQFSFLPWKYDNETISIARKFAHLHETVIGDEIEAAAKDAVRHGWPIVRPLWWLAPTDEVALNCDSQFLLGDHVLVAPILHQGARSRDVYLPGEQTVRWRDYFARDPRTAKILTGGTWIRNKTVELDQIAVFIRVDVGLLKRRKGSFRAAGNSEGNSR